MKKKINFKAKSIEALMYMGMSKAEAETYFNRQYRSALASTRGLNRNINVTKELYASMFYATANTFTIDSDHKYTLNKIYQGSSNLSADITMSRMNEFFNKYSGDKELMNIRQEYKSGNITRKEFNEKISTCKSTNVKYLISGSK